MQFWGLTDLQYVHYLLGFLAKQCLGQEIHTHDLMHGESRNGLLQPTNNRLLFFRIQPMLREGSVVSGLPLNGWNVRLSFHNDASLLVIHY